MQLLKKKEIINKRELIRMVKHIYMKSIETGQYNFFFFFAIII